VHHGGASTRQTPETMFAQLWRSRLRYYSRFHGPTYNRLVHALVRLGLRKRLDRDAARVREIAA
jgi:ribosomal protein L20